MNTRLNPIFLSRISIFLGGIENGVCECARSAEEVFFYCLRRIWNQISPYFTLDRPENNPVFAQNKVRRIDLKLPSVLTSLLYRRMIAIYAKVLNLYPKNVPLKLKHTFCAGYIKNDSPIIIRFCVPKFLKNELIDFSGMFEELGATEQVLNGGSEQSRSLTNGEDPMSTTCEDPIPSIVRIHNSAPSKSSVEERPKTARPVSRGKLFGRGEESVERYIQRMRMVRKSRKD